MKKVVLLRDKEFSDKATLGTLLIYDERERQIFKSESLERGWRNNENMVSCIPAGIYPLKLEYSDKFKKKLWELKNVKNRSECKIHASNYWRQLNGCIAPGNKRVFLDKDDVLDVTSSNVTLRLFHEAMGEDVEAEIHVINVKNII